MSARKPAGSMLLENVLKPPIGFGDVRISALCDRAAEYHGFANAQAMLDYSCWFSDYQLPEHRRAGEIAWYMRNHGFEMAQQYCTIVRNGDGAFLGQRRELQKTMTLASGNVAFLVSCEPVHEMPHIEVPDLELWGIDPEDVHAYCGEYTTAQIREQLRTDTLSLPYPEILRTIIGRCAVLSTDYFGIDPTKALDIALSDSVAWTTHGRTPGLVSLRQNCGTCNWSWFSRSGWSDECPQCRAVQKAPVAVVDSSPSRTGETMGMGL